MDGTEDDILWNDGIETPADDDFDEADVRNDAAYDDGDLITDNQMRQMFLAESDSDFDGFDDDDLSLSLTHLHCLLSDK